MLVVADRKVKGGSHKALWENEGIPIKLLGAGIGGSDWMGSPRVGSDKQSLALPTHLPHHHSRESAPSGWF